MDTNGIIRSIFGVPRALIGVIHVAALPGTPAGRWSVAEIVDSAVEEARIYAAGGFHGLTIENTHDRPYLKGAVGPEITAAMAVIGAEVRRAVGLPLGVQILAGANTACLAVAQACGAAFVRVEGFVFAHVADEGLIESTAGELLRYRRAIGADGIRIFTDIKKKHSAHAITADVDLVETAKAAEFFQSDGVIVSGLATGLPTDPDEVRAVSAAVAIPTLVGSGVTPENLAGLAAADALIVGSSVKEGGVWCNRLDERNVRAIAVAFERSAGQ
jgi:membrane complex biogenesis BtpA family protein